MAGLARPFVFQLAVRGTSEKLPLSFTLSSSGFFATKR